MDVTEKVMQTYAMMVSLNPVEEASTRAQLASFLNDKSEDEHQLTVEALKYLRGEKLSRRRRG